MQNGKILNNKFKKRYVITTETIAHVIKEKIQTHKKLENIKIGNRTPKEIEEILEIIEIEKLNIDLQVGTPWISSTISLVIFLASIIPIIYEKTDNRNGNLKYNVQPCFNKFKLDGKIELIFKVTPLQLICIYSYLKRKNNEKKKEREKYEQSSYRGLDEYGYE